MRKLMIMAMVLVLFASPAFAVVVGSKHDLSASAGFALPTVRDTGTTTQVCVFCHTPHGAQTGAGPLWNRSTAVAGDGTALVTSTYENPNNTMAAGAILVADANDTDAPLCLGCHDGTVGDVLVNEPNDANTSLDETTAGGGAFNASAANLGTTLNNDHPIGMAYDDVSAGQELVAVGSVPYPLYTSDVGGTPTANVVWCSSCHDVHGKDSGSGDYPFFLNDSMDNSTLCTNCHIK